MPMFSRQTLESVQHLPLVDVVSTHVRLSRVGSNWRGLSPFSQEKTPSFYVRTDVNRFKDFSSGLSGDGIKFIMELEKLTFPEAVESLAERFNIPVEYDQPDPKQAHKRSLRRELIDLHDYAADYFHRAFLADNAEGEGIRAYWTEKRKFTLEEAKEWKIGFAPSRNTGMAQWLHEKGFSPDALRESGLFFIPKQAPLQVERYRPRFQGRLMIPIHNIQNQVIAFTARQTDWTPDEDPAKEAKYVNSPETPIFHKSRMLFNLNRAHKAVRESGRFLLVEGQLDALRCTSVGLGFAVAPQGSSLAEEQLQLLHRHTHRLDLLLDADAAGTKAALRLMPIAFRAGMDVRCLPLPAKSDPDDFFREQGAAGLEKLEEEPLSAMAFIVRTLLPERPTAIDREQTMKTIFGFLENIDAPVRQAELLEEAITQTGIQPEAGRRAFELHLGEVRRSRQRGRAAARPAESGAAPEKEEAEFSRNPALTSPESEILWAVLKDANRAHRILQVINLEWIQGSEIEGQALSHILNEISAGNWENLDSCLSDLDDPRLRDCLNSQIVDDKQIKDEHEFLAASLNALKKRFYRRRLKELQDQMADENQNPETFQSLFGEFRETQQALMNYEPVVLPD